MGGLAMSTPFAKLPDWRRSGTKGQAVMVRPLLKPGSPAALADAGFEALRAGAGAMLPISALANLPLAAAIAALVLWIREEGSTWGSPLYFAGLALIAVFLAAG